MELAVLITVNLVTAVILYILFSLRFTVAVEKAKKEAKLSAVKDLKQNVEQAVRLMDDTLEIMDQKLNTFYALVRKSEELAETLSRKQPRKKGSLGTGAASEKSPPPKKPSGKKKRVKTEEDSVPEWETENPSESAYMNRLLDSVGGEKIEISSVNESAMDLFEKGRLTESREPADVPSQEGLSVKNANGALESLGGIFRKALGIARIPSDEKRSEAAPPGPSFSELVQNESEKSESARPAAKMNDASVQNSEGFRLESDVYERDKRSPDEIVREYYESSSDPDRRELVKMLFQRGFDSGQISRSVQMNRTEVELIASMPEESRSVRKLRLEKEEG